MIVLLHALGWSPTRHGMLRFLSIVAATTAGVVAGTLAIGALTGIAAGWIQLAMWIGWLLWLGVFFPRSRLRMDASNCGRRYHLAFTHELLLGIGVNFAMLLRPAACGLLSGPSAIALSNLAGACLSLGGVALIASATSVIGVARAFFVHEYEEVLGGLVLRGVYARIRHPLFVGGTTLSLGLALAVGSRQGVVLAMLNVGMLPAYLYFEERRCSMILGDAYERYRAISGAVIPRDWRRLSGVGRWKR